jgi:maltose alpha-D-glucosyltransferase / alpha-amylase
MSLRQGERTSLEWIMSRTPPIHPANQWCIFLRNHDELTLEMVTPEERDWMWKEYAPEPRMRLNLGIRRRLSPLLDGDRRKIELANSILFTMPGTPIIYYGDEIGMGDNIWLEDRNGVRTPMQWDNSPSAGFSSAPQEKLYAPVIASHPYTVGEVNVADQLNDPGSLMNFIRKLIHTVKSSRAFGEGDFRWAKCENKAIAAYYRIFQKELPAERVLIVQNLSGKDQEATLQLPKGAGLELTDLLTGKIFKVPPDGELRILMAPYAYYWIQIEPEGAQMRAKF